VQGCAFQSGSWPLGSGPFTLKGMKMKVRATNEAMLPKAVNGNGSPVVRPPAKPMPTCTYLTTKELSEKIKYTEMSIRNCLQDSVLLEGIHYIRPFGSRKVLYVWEAVEAEMRLRAGCGPIGAPANFSAPLRTVS
jgi:hypothetical protein